VHHKHRHARSADTALFHRHQHGQGQRACYDTCLLPVHLFCQSRNTAHFYRDQRTDLEIQPLCGTRCARGPCQRSVCPQVDRSGYIPDFHLCSSERHRRLSSHTESAVTLKTNQLENLTLTSSST